MLQVEAVRNDDEYFGRFSYRIADGLPERTDERTFYELAVRHLRTALSAKGLFEAPADLAPDMIIEVDFGMDAPMIAVNDSFGLGWGGDRHADLRASEIVYDKYIRITARETPEQARGRPPRELWSIYVTNTDEQSNLPRYILLMISAAMDLVGERSLTRKTVVLTVKDERVVFVEKGL